MDSVYIRVPVHMSMSMSVSVSVKWTLEKLFLSSDATLKSENKRYYVQFTFKK
jgi:hypothetical protein